MPNPDLIAVSRSDIEGHLIDYFSTRYKEKPGKLTYATDVRARYGFEDDDWATLAGALSEEKWMTQIQVNLSSLDILKAKTIADLTVVIWKFVPKLVAPPKSVFAANIERLTSTKRTTKRRKPTGKTKKRKGKQG